MIKSAESKNNKKIVGYTSGVFDLFHVGHLNILNRAKSLCDKLIVGITVDELVEYKNSSAIIPFKERLEIVQNIRCVDLALPQDHLDKYTMWKKLKFDVMFIGDDWYNTERFEKFEDKLSEVGVQIIYLPYTEGVSTSKIKEKLYRKLVGNHAFSANNISDED
jgi:glycerol-3-phosphate cytidylyltransferase